MRGRQLVKKKCDMYNKPSFELQQPQLRRYTKDNDQRTDVCRYSASCAP